MLNIHRSLDRFIVSLRRRRTLNRIRRRLPKAAPGSPPARGTVTIAGIFRSPTGIGEGARLNACAFADIGYSVGLVDITSERGNEARITQPQGANLVAGDIGGPIIIHMNPPTMLHTLYALRHKLAGRRVIANWVWELPILPPVWHQTIEFLHEVWVQSRLGADAVAPPARRIPIRLVPY